jgi:nucleoside-diphosphate-sugar epimerase
VLASSVCVYGVTYAEGNVDFASFPVDESVTPRPMDAYSLSKLCMENTGQAFAARFPGVDIYALRIGAVIGPDEYTEKFRGYLNDPHRWKVHGWSYTDARDLAQICKSSPDFAYSTQSTVHERS